MAKILGNEKQTQNTQKNLRRNENLPSRLLKHSITFLCDRVVEFCGLPEFTRFY